MALRAITRQGEGWSATRVTDPAERWSAVVSTTLEPDREAITLVTTDTRSWAGEEVAETAYRALCAQLAEAAAMRCTIPPPEGWLMAAGTRRRVGTDTHAFDFYPVDRLRAVLWEAHGKMEFRFQLDAADERAVHEVGALMLATQQELRDRQAGR